jgi:hypothetical protein
LGLRQTVEALGNYQELGEVISGIQAVNPEYPIVTHSEEADFTLLSAPDHIAVDYGCSRRLSGADPLPEPEDLIYGNHYVLSFEVKTFTGEPAVLFTLWGRRGGQWKIIAYHIEMA